MNYIAQDQSYIVRLSKGEQLVASLTSLVKKEDIQGAWISGLGGSLSVELGFYQLDTKYYDWKIFDQLLEITSLQGNVSWVDGEPKLHIHGSFSDEKMCGLGGHVKELTVSGTCEIKLDVIDVSLSRRHDEAIGLDLLDL